MLFPFPGDIPLLSLLIPYLNQMTIYPHITYTVGLKKESLGPEVSQGEHSL